MWVEAAMGAEGTTGEPSTGSKPGTSVVGFRGGWNRHTVTWPRANKSIDVALAVADRRGGV